jgi:hypothetical protein
MALEFIESFLLPACLDAGLTVISYSERSESIQKADFKKARISKDDFLSAVSTPCDPVYL